MPVIKVCTVQQYTIILEVQLISVEARGPILSIFFDYYLLITNSLFGIEKLW